MSTSQPHEDGSIDVSMATFIGHDTMDFGESRIFYKQIRYLTSHGDSLNTEIWFPHTPTDSSRLIVMLPGFKDPALSLYPLAIQATNRGSIVMIANPRGYDLNTSNREDYGTLEGRDVLDALNMYQTQIHSPLTFKVFGNSLGSALALNLLVSDPRAQRAALESIMLDPQTLAHTMLGSGEYDTLQALLKANATNNLIASPKSILESNTISKSVLVIWGKEDKLVGSEERAELKSLIQKAATRSVFIEADGGGHALRYGFPMTKETAFALNKTIVDFLVGN